MRRRPLIILISLLVILAGLYLIFWNGNKKPGSEEPHQQPIAQGANTGAFNESFDRLLTAYYAVKDALFASDTAKANKAAADLIYAADSLKINEINGDSTGTLKGLASDYAGTLSGSGKGLLGEQTIDAKRKEFEMMTEAMWNLSRSVKYGGRKIYYQYCPMAFDNKGAYWMSNERGIKNPYFGDKMPDCGSLEDSLDYSKKN
jgi:uncharacterized protein DUF3347